MRRFLLPAILASLGLGCGGGGDQYSVSLDRTTVRFDAEYRAASPATQVVHVAFEGDGVLVGYPAGVSAARWLTISAPSTATGGRWSFTLGIDATAMVPGTYTTRLRVAAGKADGSSYAFEDLPVTLVLHDVPTVATPRLDFTTVAGATSGPADLPFVFTFASASTAWTIESDQPWATPARTEGTGGASVAVHVWTGALAAGVHEARLTVRAKGRPQGATATVRLTSRPRRLWTSLDGVALADVPGRPHLSRDVILYDNAGTDGVTWSAASDQAWLTAQIMAGDTLRLTADPAAAPLGWSLANVIVHSDGARVEGPTTVRVGLWRTDTAPPEGALVDLFPRDVGPYPSTALAVDPIRPRLYVLDGGSEVRGFNAYTGAVEATFPSIPGETIGSLVPSSDGRWLYAGSTTSLLVHRLDLDSGSWGEPLAYTGTNYGATFLYFARPEGWPLLLGNVNLDLTSGSELSRNGGSVFGPLFEDQRHFVGGDLAYDRDTHLLTYSLDPVVEIFNDTELGIMRDGSRAVTNGSLLAGGYGFSVYAADAAGVHRLQTVINAPAYPSVAEFGDDGVLYAGRDAYYDPDTVTAYGPDYAPLRTYSVGTYRSLLRGKRGLKVSSDGRRLLLLTTQWAYGAKTTLWGFDTVP